MDSVCVITDLKKRLQGQTMELETLRKEGKGELVYCNIIVPITVNLLFVKND